MDFPFGYWLQPYPEIANVANVQQPEMALESEKQAYNPVRNARGQSIYKCPNCSRFYMRNSCLKRHLRVECGQAPKYQCKICMGWFKYKHNLSAHMKLHCEEPKHHCNLCLKKFYRRDKLVEHQKKAHKIFPVT
ncbi:zinc finger protein 131-like [Calliopsis andreniformis]|uniref:zinc finger protein 131-like n=1 Tax=Calliopsis andreniformis TaxID=337506 RepID=UPI003FCEB439